MRRTAGFAFSGLVLVSLAGLVPSLTQAADDKMERGRYLVEEVSKCQDCHTPRNADGTLDKAKWMKGATLDFAPSHEVPGWHKTSPDITGPGRVFQRWADKGVTEFMMTAKNPRGGKADPPMPDYHMNKEDAEAVTAYLKSLQ